MQSEVGVVRMRGDWVARSGRELGGLQDINYTGFIAMF